MATRRTHIPTRRLVLGALLALSLGNTYAWTDKPIKLVVPAPAGGTMDVVARAIADQLSVTTGQPVIVDNKPGAGGAIGVQAMNSAPPDGQTLMVTASNVLTEIPHVMKTAFDPLKDVRPVTAIARSSMVLIAAPNFEPKDLRSAVAYAKAHPGQLAFASYSAGTASHYAGMILNKAAGLDLQHVPFPGSPPALAQVMGGQIPLMFDGMATSRPLILAGKVQVYGIAAKSRSSLLPNVPTLAELGYPDLDFSNWVGIVAPAGVPAATIERIHATFTKVAASPKVRERLVGAGFEMDPDVPPAQLAQAVKAEYERNAGIVKAFSIKLQ